ncbi:tyrosine-protein phosphatase [Leucobacter coleopterorum]|uniref:Tyrosine-protein phosphatase n=1 Tax=Leucobacter coleopterorum TaxID=2714933 RepID=A0ABX6JXG1_9MICO|nr:tyrosine-protein phosphatase [Leucobacter coleopterorum]QIM19017.1 tyrosine-protein phosphatase [Leucobacter coleopterorum]
MTLIDSVTARSLHESATVGSRAIPLTPPVNLRDLGGIPMWGGRVREGFAIRADDLATASAGYVEGLVSGGLRAVIDLRSQDELDITGRGPLGEQSAVSYHHVPLMASIGSAVEKASGSDGTESRNTMMDQSSYGPMYLRMFETAAPQIVTALAVIAHAPGAVAFHCAAGQDRTGVLAASLLLALGASRESVVADYVATGANSEAIQIRISPVLAPLVQRMGFDLNEAARAATRKVFSDAPMREALDTLTERHGDPLEPLRVGGLTDTLVDALRERALAPERG